jgi:glycopeptide antibiotics resistance protein
MVSVGGPWVMLLGAAGSLAACVLLAVLLRPWLGSTRAWCVAGLVWTVVVVALVTLVPASGAPGIIPAEEAQTSCSWDIGGPAPEGFWIFSGGQRLLNTALFVPPGFFLGVLLGTRRRWWLSGLGVVLLAAYSAGIEATQLALARLDRACDATDVLDNTTGAVIGVGMGLVAAGTGWLVGRSVRAVRTRSRR